LKRKLANFSTTPTFRIPEKEKQLFVVVSIVIVSFIATFLSPFAIISNYAALFTTLLMVCIILTRPKQLGKTPPDVDNKILERGIKFELKQKKKCNDTLKRPIKLG
jgi:hypothetical protein